MAVDEVGVEIVPASRRDYTVAAAGGTTASQSEDAATAEDGGAALQLDAEEHRPPKRRRYSGDRCAGQAQEQHAQQKEPSSPVGPLSLPGNDSGGGASAGKCAAAATPEGAGGTGRAGAAIDGACLQASPHASPLRVADPAAPHELSCAASPRSPAAEDAGGGLDGSCRSGRANAVQGETGMEVVGTAAGGAAVATPGAGDGGGGGESSQLQQHQAAQLQYILVEHYPSVLRLLHSFSEPHSQQSHGCGSGSVGLPVLPREVLHRYTTTGLGWNYKMVIRPATPEANSSTGAAAAAMPAFEATVTLRSRDLSASAEAKGKAAADMDTAEQLAAAAFLQNQLAAGVSPDRLWAQQQQPQPQHTPAAGVAAAPVAQHGSSPDGPEAAAPAGAMPPPGNLPAAASPALPPVGPHAGGQQAHHIHHNRTQPCPPHPFYTPGCWHYLQSYAYFMPPPHQQQQPQQQHPQLAAWMPASARLPQPQPPQLGSRQEPAGACASAPAERLGGAPTAGAASCGGAGDDVGGAAPPPMPPHPSAYPAGYYWPLPHCMPMPGPGGPYAGYPQPPSGAWGAPPPPQPQPPAGAQWPQGPWPYHPALALPPAQQ